MQIFFCEGEVYEPCACDIYLLENIPVSDVVYDGLLAGFPVPAGSRKHPDLLIKVGFNLE